MSLKIDYFKELLVSLLRKCYIIINQAYIFIDVLKTMMRLFYIRYYTTVCY